MEMSGYLQEKKKNTKPNTSQVPSSHVHGDKAITVLKWVECKAKTEGCPYSLKASVTSENLGQSLWEKRCVEVIT